MTAESPPAQPPGAEGQQALSPTGKQDAAVRDVLARKGADAGASKDLLPFILTGKNTDVITSGNSMFSCARCLSTIGAHCPVYLRHDYTYCTPSCRDSAATNGNAPSSAAKWATRVSSENSNPRNYPEGSPNSSPHQPPSDVLLSSQGSLNPSVNPKTPGVLRLIGDALVQRIQERVSSGVWGKPEPEKVSAKVSTRVFSQDLRCPRPEADPAPGLVEAPSIPAFAGVASAGCLAYVPCVDGYGKDAMGGYD
jgi:hypothetical protein